MNEHQASPPVSHAAESLEMLKKELDAMGQWVSESVEAIGRASDCLSRITENPATYHPGEIPNTLVALGEAKEAHETTMERAMAGHALLAATTASLKIAYHD